MSFNSWNQNSTSSFRGNSFGNTGGFGQTPNSGFVNGFGAPPGFQGQPPPTVGVQAPQPQGFGGFGGFGSNPAPANTWGGPPQNTGFGGQPQNTGFGGQPQNTGFGGQPQNTGGFNSNPFMGNNSFSNPGQGGVNPFNQPNNSVAPGQTAPNFGAPAFGANQNSFNQAPGFNSSFGQNAPMAGTSMFPSNPNPQANPSQPFNNNFSTAASPFSAGSQPAGGLFSNNSFSNMSTGMNAFGTSTAVKYKPTAVREDSSTINVMHLCALPEMGGKSIEEQRLFEYKQRPNASISNPAMPINTSVPGASLTGAFNPNPIGIPFASNPLQSQTSLFAKPAEIKPAGSLFQTAQANPSMLSNQTTGGSSLFSQSPSFCAIPSNPSNPSPQLATSVPGSQPSLFSSSSLFNPSPQVAGTTPSFLSAPSAGSLFNPTAQPSLQSSLFGPKPAQPGLAQSQPVDAFSSAFRDPHGLNWLFPDIIPETVIKNYKERYSAQLSAEPLSAVERLFKPKRVNNYPQILTEKWKLSQEKKSLKSNSSFDMIANRQAEPFFVSKRTNFTNLKLEVYKDEDGSKYFKLPGSNSNKPEQLIDITVKAHDPSPIKMNFNVGFDKTVREIKAEVKKILTDIEENCIQLIYKSKILSPEDTVRSLGISNKDELLVINAPIVHNVKTELPSQDMLPKIPAGYNTIPTYIEMARMSVDELKKIENFTVFNKFGKVMFYGRTDVIGLDIAAAFKIVENEIIGYPDEDKKPPVGKGLNKPSEFTMFNMRISGNKDKAQQKARIMCEKNETEFVSYTQETSEFVVRLKHL